MKFFKLTVLVITITAIASTFFMPNSQPSIKDDKMKFVHAKTGFVVAEFQGDKTIIHDRILEKEMQVRGIAIPTALREEFGGKAAVRLNDKEFQKAFKDLYSPQAFNPQSYDWEEN